MSTGTVPHFMQLTGIQETAWRWACTYYLQHSHAPSITEIAHGIRRSTSTTLCIVRALRAKGYLWPKHAPGRARDIVPRVWPR